MDIIGRKLLVADLDALVSRIGLQNIILNVVTRREYTQNGSKLYPPSYYPKITRVIVRSCKICLSMRLIHL